MFPETVGVQAGQAATIWFKIGNKASVWHKLTNTLITFAGPVNDNTGDVFRMVIQGQDGTFTAYTTSTPSTSG